jgi:hypothetical protein
MSKSSEQRDILSRYRHFRMGKILLSDNQSWQSRGLSFLTATSKKKQQETTEILQIISDQTRMRIGPKTSSL